MDKPIGGSSNSMALTDIFSVSHRQSAKKEATDIATIVTVNDVTDYYELAAAEKS